MYAFDIIIANKKFTKKHDEQYENWVHQAYDYVFHLERTGQILKTNGRVIINENTIRLSVVCPERSSLNIENCSSYNLEVIQQIEENTGSKIAYQLIGVDADYQNYKVPTKSSFYILRSGWTSPLLCGDTHQPVPLYKFPKTDHNDNDYDNIFFWKQDYERLYGLWLSSGAYEGFAQDQLQDVSSPINQTGRELCALIEKLTGVATYYFLFNYRAYSIATDKLRKCPVTGKDWLIEGSKASDFIAFKCDESRLVSELSANSNLD